MHELPGVHLELVLSRPDSALWNEYIDRYHYLGYTPLAGAQLRYFARWEDRILALLGEAPPPGKPPLATASSAGVLRNGRATFN